MPNVGILASGGRRGISAESQSNHPLTPAALTPHSNEDRRLNRATFDYCSKRDMEAPVSFSPRDGEHHMQANGSVPYGAPGEYPDPNPLASPWILAHAMMMAGALLVLLPIGASLGLTRRSKLHAPLQAVSLALMVLGSTMPSMGRIFSSHNHGELKTIGGHRLLGSLLVILLVGQGTVGFLIRKLKHSSRLLAEESWQAIYGGRFEVCSALPSITVSSMRTFHSIVGTSIFVVPYFVFIWGIVGANGWCVEEPRHLTGQCVGTLGNAQLSESSCATPRRLSAPILFFPSRSHTLSKDPLLSSWGSFTLFRTWVGSATGSRSSRESYTKAGRSGYGAWLL